MTGLTVFVYLFFYCGHTIYTILIVGFTTTYTISAYYQGEVYNTMW